MPWWRGRGGGGGPIAGKDREWRPVVVEWSVDRDECVEALLFGRSQDSGLIYF